MFEGLGAIRRPFYGWWIVGVAFLSLFLSGGVGTAFSVLLPVMAEQLGWPYSSLVGAASLGVVTGAVVGPAIGRVVDARGARLVLALGAALTAITVAATGFVKEPWQFYLAFGLVGGAARAAMMNVAPVGMIANWFVRRRAVASGVAAMGPPASSLVLPPIIAIAGTAFSWRWAWLGLGTAIGALALPPVVLLVRRRPEDLGLEPDGGESPNVGQAPSPARTDEWTLHEAIHSRAFWGVAASMALIGVMPHTVFLFLPASFRAQGLTDTAAAATLSLMGFAQVVSRVALWTPLVARLGSVQRALMLWGGLLTLSALLLAVAHGEVAGYLASGFLGLAMGANLVLQLLVWPEYFGRRAVGAISGVAHLLGGLAGAAGPVAAAALVDLTGDYTLLYLSMAGVVLAGLILQLAVGRPEKTGPRLPRLTRSI